MKQGERLMNLKPTTFAAAALLALAGNAAQASLTFATSANGGTSSVAFVALDNAGSISYTADLGVFMQDFMPLISGNTAAAGGISAAGTTAIWNLRNNTYTLNGVSTSLGSQAPAWSSNLTSFLTAAGAGSYQWGVVAGETISGNQGPGNVVRGLNLMFTSGSVVDYDTSNASGVSGIAVAGGAGQVTEFFATSNTAGGNTHSAGRAGSNTATSGTAFLGTSMVLNGTGNFSQQFGNNNYMQNPGDVSYFSFAQSNGPAGVSLSTFGAALGIGQDPALPATWRWDEVTGNLTYTVPVPEASTTAMLLGGLAAMGIALRRRVQR